MVVVNERGRILSADTNRRADLLRAIDASAGMAHVNRTYSRGFSVNIFLMNAQELTGIINRVRDPQEGLRLWNVDNREAQAQVHREVNRLVHNFVAAAHTLVEHTRVFMKEHYTNTAVYDLYLRKVHEDFTNLPLARFVQDLRNYILHRGLPASDYYFHAGQDPNKPEEGQTFTMGIRYKTSDLLEWDSWKPPAKKYLTSIGDHLDIHVFTDEYVQRVVSFHQWLDAELNNFHSDDLAQLSSLQSELRVLTGEAAVQTIEAGHAPATLDQSASHVETPPFEFPNETITTINEIGATILGDIRKIEVAGSQGKNFPTARPVGGPVVPIETPKVWCNDAEGKSVLLFIESDTGAFGLDIENVAKLGPLGDKVLETAWARRSLSRKFVEGVTLDWCRTSFLSADAMQLSEALATSARKKVKKLEVWVPIAHLEVETRFEFGPVRIAPITSEMIDELQAEGCSNSPKQRDDVLALFAKIRSEMQGLAAVVVNVEASYARKLVTG